MKGVREGQLWTSPEHELYYVRCVTLSGLATLYPVTVEGKGRRAHLRTRRGASVMEIKTSEMLEWWMPTTMNPPVPPPTWHQRLLADDD